ncbi:hypothetical protein JTE90_022532 [Oedothorax gibbosus]|uniref:Uncharacterized protein n=1 Tax=Oedothorax gibbosus TaxID=931172 RepID=A0AAV6TIX3_9ARAC|nr:hypothetical protein JTE90_022532 [Oedothorax gibbosus]
MHGLVPGDPDPSSVCLINFSMVGLWPTHGARNGVGRGIQRVRFREREARTNGYHIQEGSRVAQSTTTLPGTGREVSDEKITITGLF